MTSTAGSARAADRRRAPHRASAVAACLVVVLGVGAEHRQPEPLGVPAGVGLAARTAHESVAGALAGRLDTSEAVWNGGPTTATTGETIDVYVSAAVSAEQGTPQTWADFLAGLLHGPELSAVTAYIATFEEMQEICGEYALGCYTPNRMVSMAETVDGVTAAEVVRHEYGHHVAFHRANPPWLAIDSGPKSWATVVNVCARTKSGSAYPGDQGRHYSLNPGEAWAETYRLLTERRAGITTQSWEIVDRSFFPTEDALLAAERDVLEPWSAPRRALVAHRFTPRGARVWTIPLTTPLDGRLELAVSLPKGGLHDIVLQTPGSKQPLATALWSGRTTKTLGTNVCGERALRLRITQKGAFGRVQIRATIP